MQTLEESYAEAVDLVVKNGMASAIYLQRNMRIGYFLASKLIDMMEDRRVIGPYNGCRPRDILMDKEGS